MGTILGNRKKYAVLAAAMGLLTSGTALAAPAIPENPGAVRENMERNNATTDIENAAPTGQTGAAGQSFALNTLNIKPEDGMKFKEGDLAQISSKYAGKQVTLNDLNAAAAEVTRYFRAHGYPAATAYLPAQKTKQGDITIAVAPGHFGTVTIENKSKAKDKVVERLAKGLKAGDVVEGKKLETVLYNIIGLGGVKAGGLLQPGAKKGESNLTIKVEDGKAETYVLYVNNHGSKAAGRYRYGLTADWYELSGIGDHVGLNGMISNAHQKNLGLRYDLSTGHSGTRVGVGVSHANYELGARLAALGAKGTATTYSLYATTPIFHTTNEALNLVYGYDYRDMTDKLSAIGYRMDKESHAGHIGLAGFKKVKKSYAAYGVTGYAGRIEGDWRMSAAGVAGKGKLEQEGSFNKGTGELTLVQTFDKKWDILLKASAQMAGKDLDSSEEMYLGGAMGVRAYPQGEGSGDSGALGTAELRYHTDIPGLTLSTYFDAGRIRAKGNNAALRNTTLKGWGLGVTYTKTNDYFARLDYARRIGLGDNVSEDAKAKGRLWFILGKIW